MRRDRTILLGGVALGWALAIPWVQAEPPSADSECAHRRAGNPQKVACWARPSITPAYVGYYVGGGCVFPRHGESRYPEEGTWGWDYSGRYFHRCVELLWWHGRCYQGGTGQYQTDGPHLRHLDNPAGGHGEGEPAHPGGTAGPGETGSGH